MKNIKARWWACNMKHKPLIIFGTGQTSEILSFYLNKLGREIFAYCVAEKYYKKKTFKNKVIMTI